MKFWDSSAVIPFLVAEKNSSRVEELAREDGHMVVWWNTRVECHSALARLRRNGTISDRDVGFAKEILKVLSGAWTEINPSNEVQMQAERALYLHPLRAADSLQLAAAIVWADNRPRGHHFLCFDERLCEAAAREGFETSNF